MGQTVGLAETFQVAPKEYDSIEQQQFRQQLQRLFELMSAEVRSSSQMMGTLNQNAIVKHRFLAGARGEVG